MQEAPCISHRLIRNRWQISLARRVKLGAPAPGHATREEGVIHLPLRFFDLFKDFLDVFRALYLLVDNGRHLAVG